MKQVVRAQVKVQIVEDLALFSVVDTFFLTSATSVAIVMCLEEP